MARIRWWMANAPLSAHERLPYGRSVTVVSVLVPILIGVAYAAANSLVPTKHRRQLNAIVVAGAGAAYLSGGFGPWELVFTTSATYVAFPGAALVVVDRGRLAAAHRVRPRALPLRGADTALRPAKFPRVRHLRPGHRPVVLRRRPLRR